ncbi:MAG: M15 family peptidase [Bacteroidetes bacterium]|nr:M15 family peptidase [Bacteroidota bacterium]
MASSQNGWPASPDRKAIDIISIEVPGCETKFAVCRKVAPIFKAFLAEFNERVEKIDKGKDDWGYAFRQVRGSTDMLSNHASGTAVDVNATKHPLGVEDTFTDAQRKTIRELCDKYGLRWGGNYVRRVDEMHFEIMESPTSVKARITRLGLDK